jgi:hypothetical protein
MKTKSKQNNVGIKKRVKYKYIMEIKYPYIYRILYLTPILLIYQQSNQITFIVIKIMYRKEVYLIGFQDLQMIFE